MQGFGPTAGPFPFLWNDICTRSLEPEREASMAKDMHTDGVDIRSGTYDAISPAGKQQPDQVREKPTASEAGQQGADVRSEPLPGTEDPIPEGLLRERKGPLNAQTGRRPTE
jgi:hypothetical protein